MANIVVQHDTIPQPTFAGVAPPVSLDVQSTHDWEAIRLWLLIYKDSNATYANYRKEAERLFLWAIHKAGKSLRSLTHLDILSYIDFMYAPDAFWIGKKMPRSSGEWKPFNCGLSQASVHQAKTAINTMFNWMVTSGYLPSNPMGLISTKVRTSSRADVDDLIVHEGAQRYFSRNLWDMLIDVIDAIPFETEMQRAVYERNRFLVRVLYLLMPRISEISVSRMKHFTSYLNDEGEIAWQLFLAGKGSKVRAVPLSVEMVNALTRYRAYNGLPPYPSPDEDHPLVLPFRQHYTLDKKSEKEEKKKTLGRQAIHSAVKGMFASAADYLVEIGEKENANLVKNASAHWLRHTGASHLIADGVDVVVARDILGHESISTTNQYVHADQSRVFNEVIKKQRLKQK